MESRLSRSLFTTFSFTWWNLGYHEAFLVISFFYDGISAITEPLHYFFFHMVESRLSRSLSYELFFSRWNLGYHEAFHTNFSFFTMESRLSRSLSYELFFFHGGISAITKPFIRTFLFSRWNIGYHGASSRIFFFQGGISAITEPLQDVFFHMVESTKCTIWGKTLFIYIAKSIYIGSASLKTLPLDLESLSVF
jgi:hypothetical protein